MRPRGAALVLADLSACRYRAGPGGVLRLRAMRVLVPPTDPEAHGVVRRRLHHSVAVPEHCPVSFLARAGQTHR